MGSYSFKSVGRTQEQVKLETQDKTTLPIGIKTPLSLGVDSLFTTHTSLADQAADNLRNLLLTNRGERLGLFEFGGDLRPILADLVNIDDFDAKVMERINIAVGRWMPYIDLEDFQSTVDRTDNRVVAPVKLRITYNIPVLNVKKRVLELTLYAM